MVATANVYTAIQAAAVVGGIALIVAIICTCIIVAVHVDKGHAIIPWGHRKRVERAKADKEIAELRVHTEMADLKHMALQPVRNKILNNIEQDDIKPLHELLAGDNGDEKSGDIIRQAAWGGKEPQVRSHF